MRVGRRAITVLGALAATTCLITGIAYIGVTADLVDIGPWLATLGILGSAALAAATAWQELGDGLPRLIALVVLAALAAGHVAANAFALIPGVGVPGSPRGLHVAGLVAGGPLYLSVLVEVSLAFRSRPASQR